MVGNYKVLPPSAMQEQDTTIVAVTGWPLLASWVADAADVIASLETAFCPLQIASI